jgi:glycosyltransferase involved in cell wall biosynthesis
MIHVISLDENYSTTKLLTKEKPIIKNNPEDSFETVLFLPQNDTRKGEGGLRTKGYFKKSYNDKPLISIVTVVYNGEMYLEETIKSVINQTYDNVEYIIIDGGSTDGTLEIIKKYEKKIDYWVSEKDSGIYDAMNKGIDLVSGKWINFMNAGDGFFDNFILATVFSEYKFENIDVIYGNTQFVYDENTSKISIPKSKCHKYHHQFVHQSAFIYTKIQKRYKFDTTFKIAGDSDFFTKIFNLGYKFLHINNTISIFAHGGISSNFSWQSIKEDIYIGTKYNKYFKYLYFYHIIIKYIKHIIKQVLPINIVRKVQKKI